MKKLLIIHLLIKSFFSYQLVFAAACCGGGSASPSLIAGDDKAQMTTSYSNQEVIVDSVSSQEIWFKSNEHQKIQNFKIDAAFILSDLWQFGISLPILQRTFQNQSSTGLGDTTLTLGYEYLPDWNYNPLRPKGIGFLQINAPTGKSKIESELNGLDSRGTGLWSIGMGTLLTKTIYQWDIFVLFDVHKSFQKQYHNKNFSGTLLPDLGGNFGFGIGYNWSDFRIGSNVTYTYEDAVRSIPDSEYGVPFDGSIERYATAAASVSYLANNEWSGTLSFSDQSLLGQPINTSLSKGIALQIQRRWAR